MDYTEADSVCVMCVTLERYIAQSNVPLSFIGIN